jgi:hypothetical protein
MDEEQDRRRIKQRMRPMLGFKRFDAAAVTITGIELAQKIKEASVQDRKVVQETANCSRDLGSCSRSLSSLENCKTQTASVQEGLHQDPLWRPERPY